MTAIPRWDKLQEMLKGPKPGSSSSSSSSSSAASVKAESGYHQRKGQLLANFLTPHNTHSHFVSMSIFPLSSQQENTSRNEVQTLLDTGNLVTAFLAHSVVDRFSLTPYIVNSNSKTVCSGLDNNCYDVSHTLVRR